MTIQEFKKVGRLQVKRKSPPPFTDEHKRRISEAHKGINTWMKGKKLSEQHIQNISKSLKGKLPKHVVGGWNKGKGLSEEHKEKLSQNHRKQNSLECRSKISEAHKRLVKEGKHPAWRGGVTPINTIIRQSFEYRLWREAVFTRDNWTCQECKERGGILQADHIKPFAYYPELRFAIDNGRTLCVACHKKTDSYLNPHYLKQYDSK